MDILRPGHCKYNLPLMRTGDHLLTLHRSSDQWLPIHRLHLPRPRNPLRPSRRPPHRLRLQARIPFLSPRRPRPLQPPRIPRPTGSRPLRFNHRSHHRLLHRLRLLQRAHYGRDSATLRAEIWLQP